MSRFSRIALPALVTIAAVGFAHAENVEVVHVEGAQSMEIAPMDVPGVNAWLEDVVSSDDPEHPITCGFFRLQKSDEPLVYDYDYDETKIILDGVITISDGVNTIDAKQGDVVLLPKGAHITFTTESEGSAYVCGARARDSA